MESYEKFWIAAVDLIFDGTVARGFAYGSLAVGLHLIVRRQRIVLGSFVMILSIGFAFGSTAFNFK